MYNNNKYNSHRLPLITPEMLRHQPDQACEILNKLSGGGGSEATVINEGTGNLEDIQQTTTSYDDGGVNIVTAYLSGGATSDFQIRNGRKGSQGDPGPAGQDGADGADGFSPVATVTKSGDTATITITDQDGTTTATVSDGAQGNPGAPGPANTLSIGTVQQGVTADATITGTSPNQTLNLTLPKGDQGPVGPANSLSIGTVQQGITADATITGTPPNQVLNLSLPKGDPGTAASIAVGNTTTLSPGSSATVTNSGTSSAAVFDFGIPQGATGTAATVAAGTTTTLPAGSSATVTNSGTSSAAVFDFGIPKGDTGATGPANTLSIGTVQSGATADATITGTSPNQTLNLTLPEGPQGSAATISVGSTTTLSPGSSATVTNSGTSSAAVFDFGIPEGQPGQDANVVTTYTTSNTDAYSTTYANETFMYSTETGTNMTIDGLAAYVSGKQGMTGSVYITKKSSGVGSAISTGWYNFFWSPHRTGRGGDNTQFGTIILTPMTFDGSSWILHKRNSTTAIASVRRILLDEVSTSQITNSAVTNDKLNWANIIAMSLSSSTTVDDNSTLGTGLNYLKFGNGLMIVFGTSEVVSIGNNNYYDWNTNLATAFKSYPFVIASITTNTAAKNGNMYASNNYSTKTQIRIRGFNSTGATRKPLLSFVAFGKWK